MAGFADPGYLGDNPALAYQHFYLRGVQDERQRILNGIAYITDLIGESFEVEGRDWANGGMTAVRGLKHFVSEGKPVPKPDDF